VGLGASPVAVKRDPAGIFVSKSAHLTDGRGLGGGDRSAEFGP
jgi:hypothetical protein